MDFPSVGLAANHLRKNHGILREDEVTETEDSECETSGLIASTGADAVFSEGEPSEFDPPNRMDYSAFPKSKVVKGSNAGRSSHIWSHGTVEQVLGFPYWVCEYCKLPRAYRSKLAELLIKNRRHKLPICEQAWPNFLRQSYRRQRPSQGASWGC
jgi:hypothetical protein